MGLRTKTLAIICLTLFVLIGTLYIAAQAILLGSFADLESQDVREQVQRVLNTLADEIETLNVVTQDYAFWDETYAFIQDPDEAYLRRNFPDALFNRYRIDVVAFVDIGGQVIFETAFDRDAGQRVPVSQGFQARLRSGGDFVWRPDPASRVGGILLLPEGPYLAASMPILTDEMQGPALGTLIWARALDAAEVARLGEAVELSLSISPYDAPGLPDDFRAAKAALDVPTAIAIYPLGDQHIAGYTLLTDIDGDLALILRVALPRRIYQQGQAAVLYFALSLLIFGAGGGLLANFLLQRLVLTREEALRQAEQHYRELFEGIGDVITVHDLEGNILAVNEAAVRQLGYTREELLRMKTTDIDAPDFAQGFEERLARQLTDRRPSSNFKGVHVARDGRTIPVDVNTTRITYKGQTAVLGVVRDITELKMAEEKLLHLNAELERYNRALRALHQTGMEVNSQLDLTELRRRIIERAVSLLDADGGNLYLYDEAVGCLRVSDGVGTGAGLVGRTLKPGDGLAGRVFLTQQPLAVEDYSSWEGRSSTYDDLVFTAVLAAPLCWRGRAIGVLNLNVDRQRHVFDEYDLWLAEMFAAQAAVAMQNAYLFEAERRQRQIADTLRDIGLVLAGALNLDETLKHLIDAAQNLFSHAWSVTVQRLDESDQTLQTIAASENAFYNPHKLAFRPGQGVAGHVIAERRVINVADVDTDPRFLPGVVDSPFHSLLVAPLIAGDRVWGTFSITAEAVGRFGPEDEKLAELLARHAAVAIENAHLYESERRQREIADTLRDIGLVLTGALNQEDVLKRILEQVARVLPYDAAAVWLAGDDGLYRMAAGVGYERFGSAEREATLTWDPTAEPFLRAMNESGRPVTVPNIDLCDAWTRAEGYEWLHSWAGAPIFAGGKIIGQFSLDHTQPGFYGPQHGPILEALATQISIAVENARLFEQVQGYAENLGAQVEARTAEIRREQLRTETILRNIGDAVIIFDLGEDERLRISYVNNAFCRLSGWTADEVIGQLARFLLHEATPEEVSQAQSRAFSMRRPWRGTSFLRHRDGYPMEIDVSSVANVDESGRVLGLIASLREIGPERVLERMKGQFMTLVSHQLRTPLTSLKLRLHLLRKTADDPEQTQKHLDLLEQQTDRLICMMEKVLNATRLTEIKVLEAPGTVSGATLVENVRVRFTTTAAENAIALRVEPASEAMPPLHGSEEWLTQACYELVENALSYTPAGGQVQVSLVERERAGRGYAVFSVQDSGPGISADDLVKLNAPFTRLDAQWWGASAGMGLGLFITRTVAEQHGGSLVVESTPGVGSTFSLWLPV